MSLGLKPKEMAGGAVVLGVLFLSTSIMFLAVWGLVDLIKVVLCKN